MDKEIKMIKKEKIFTKKNFVEREAEEEDENDIKKIKKLDSAPFKDTQYSSDLNNEEEDSYGISSENETEKVEKQIITNRLLLNKEKMEKEKKVKRKRKSMPEYEKKDKKKNVIKQIEKNMNKVDRTLGIVNGKLNICFDENRENKDVNVEDMNKTPEKKLKIEEDEDILLLKMSVERKNISNINKNDNKDFIKRMKENENFLKNNNIIINDGSKRSKSVLINNGKNKKFPKIKLFNMKGAFLAKKKK